MTHAVTEWDRAHASAPDGWLPMRYRDFYDVPRLVVVEFGDELYLFDSPFDDSVDDYLGAYTVRRLPPDAREIVDDDSWDPLDGLGEVVGHVGVDEVQFDETRRAAVSSRAFALLGLA